MLNTEQVLSLIVHENPEVRFRASEYIDVCPNPPANTADVFWQAFDRYGIECAHLVLHFRWVPQSDAACSRLIESFAKPLSHNSLWFLCKLINRMPLSYLQKHQTEVLNAAELADEAYEPLPWKRDKGRQSIAKHLAARLQLCNRSPEELWTALEQFAAKVDRQARSRWDWRHDFRLIEALIQHPDFAVQRSMQQLAGPERSWMDVFAAEMLGMLRHRPAIDLLFGMLDDSLSSDFSSATDSLAQIGGEEIHQRLLTDFAGRKGKERRHLLDTVAAQQTPQAERSLIDLIQAGELEGEELATATNGLVDMFTTDGIDLLRQLVREERYYAGWSDLREDVLILGEAAGVAIPEAAEWEKAIAEEVAERKGSFLCKPEPSEATSNATESLQEEQSPAESIKVGRNDPCPCGSGKKYKKCCIDRG